MIFTGFQPNATQQDFKKSISFLFLPWKWPRLRMGEAPERVEKWLTQYFGTTYAYTFDSGRTALQKALEAFELEESDEVLVQAYTCVVVVNAIKWAGAKPVYVDVGRDLNMNPVELESKITDKSKVLIIQHTFGKSADLQNLMNIAKKHNLKVIEDCAHTIGGEYHGQKLGTFGDIGMFSFGSDKVVSCVRGGALITNDIQLANRLAKIQEELPESTRTKILQFLANIPIFMLFKPLYQYGVGKWFLSIFKKLNITGRIIYEKEKKGEQVSFYPSKFPNALAEILLDQLKDLEQINIHRREISKLYQDLIQNKTILPVFDPDTIPLRFNLLVDNPKKLHELSKKNAVMLGDWYDSVIAPSTAELERTGYIFGTCPNAEKFAKTSINLPTSRHISQADAKRIVDILNN